MIVNRSVSTRPTSEKPTPSLQQATYCFVLLRDSYVIFRPHIAPTPFRMYHSAPWRADDPGHPGARKSTQSRGTIDNVCLQGSHPYNCGTSLPKADNVSCVHLPMPSVGCSCRTDLPRIMNCPSDLSIAIPGISSIQLRNEPCQAGTDHGRFWDERSRSHASVADDQTPLGRKSDTPSDFPPRFRLPPIQTLKSSESLWGKPTGFGAYFSVNAPPPQLSTNPHSGITCTFHH